MKERIKKRIEAWAVAFLKRRGLVIFQRDRYDYLKHTAARLAYATANRDGRSWHHRVTHQSENLYHLITKAPR